MQRAADLAEGEELGSNLLHVDYRSLGQAERAY